MFGVQPAAYVRRVKLSWPGGAFVTQIRSEVQMLLASKSAKIISLCNNARYWCN